VTDDFIPGRNGGRLRRIPKGVSGNPKGRPKLPDLSQAMAAILADEKDGKTALDAILAALRAKAAKGDVRAAQLLLDRGYGKPKETIDHTSGGEKIVAPPIAWVDTRAKGDSDAPA
jgi:hypothetical protein